MELSTAVTGMASQGLRTLCLAYADVTADALGPLVSLEGASPQLPPHSLLCAWNQGEQQPSCLASPCQLPFFSFLSLTL